MYAIPRTQLVRPGHRRSLMRRALPGIVPDELLNRKRKAFVVRASLAAISKEWTSLVEMSQHMVSSSFGIIDARDFCEVLQRGRQGQEVPIVPVIRTIGIEYWLRNLADSKLIDAARSGGANYGLRDQETAIRHHKWGIELNK